MWPWRGTDVTDASRSALLQKVQERATAIHTQLLFFDIEWAALDDDRVAALLADERLGFCRHHLESERRYRDHLLSEPEERILAEKAATGRAAWSRLFNELTSTLQVSLDGRAVTLEAGLSELASSDPERRRLAAAAVTEATGQPVAYADVPPAEQLAVLTGAGVPPSFAEILVDVDQSTIGGALEVEGDDLRTLIGRPTTTLADALQQAVAAR